MLNEEDENDAFTLAAEIVQYTACNLFLTGKAGTGKTTFLKYIRENCHKNTVVVAPTGVAAVNAGGVTMHSFFQLPFIPYLANETRLYGNSATTDKYGLLKNIKFSKQKIDLLLNLDLLVIDEVSMLRADLLDAIDTILRHYRQKPNLPFGGVQMLFIGDLYQLPPVVSDDEWKLMEDYYESPFFFSAKVLTAHSPVFIELKKIYRQKEATFINLLDHIRHNKLDENDYLLLQSLYRPADESDRKDAITLTTHNYIADTINQQELSRLPGRLYAFEGEIQGDFSDKSFPTEKDLSLKVGAQIMFIKNDLDPAKRYYNGKLAKVVEISHEEVIVALADSEIELKLEKEKWSNVRYVLNKETNKVDEEELGSFTQYPIRLAWAITIHKSQGLTFDKAIIDAGKSFAPGQVYAALSRCRTLDGIILLSRIQQSSILNDERILAFSEKENQTEELLSILAVEKPRFAAQQLLKAFDWSTLVVALKQFESDAQDKKLPEKETIQTLMAEWITLAIQQQETADKFLVQLNRILGETPVQTELLNERVVKAKQYFVNILHQELLPKAKAISELLRGKTKVKQFLKKLNELETFIWAKIDMVQRISYGDFNFEIPLLSPEVAKETKKTTTKGDSKLETLAMYKEGMSVADIVAQRGLVQSTIESHLSYFVSSGEVNALDFVNKEIVAEVEKAVADLGNEQLSALRAKLGEEVTYAQIKFALAYLQSK